MQRQRNGGHSTRRWLSYCNQRNRHTRQLQLGAVRIHENEEEKIPRPDAELEVLCYYAFLHRDTKSDRNSPEPKAKTFINVSPDTSLFILLTHNFLSNLRAIKKKKKKMSHLLD